MARGVLGKCVSYSILNNRQHLRT